MQYLEFYAVRHDTGAVLPNATAQAFAAGGSTPLTIYSEAGQPVGTQVSADALGKLGVALPFGAYDLQISSAGYCAAADQWLELRRSYCRRGCSPISRA